MKNIRSVFRCSTFWRRLGPVHRFFIASYLRLVSYYFLHTFNEDGNLFSWLETQSPYTSLNIYFFPWNTTASGYRKKDPPFHASHLSSSQTLFKKSSALPLLASIDKGRMVDRYKGGFSWVNKGLDRDVMIVCVESLMKTYVRCCLAGGGEWC